MWIILLSLFVFAEVITAEIDCDKDFWQNCRRPKLFGEIPLEVEVFKSQCPELSPYIECLRDFDMKCEDDNNRRFQETEKYADFIAVLDEICEEGSALNEVATSNLKCFNETFSNSNCLQEMDAFVKPYMDPEEYGIPLRIHCLSEILLAGCVVKDITKNCGMRARYATLEYVHRSGIVEASCTLSNRESLLTDIDEFKLSEEQKTFAIYELERLKNSDDN